MKKRIFSIMDTGKKKAGVFIFCAALVITLGTGLVFAANGNDTAGDETAACEYETDLIYATNGNNAADDEVPNYEYEQVLNLGQTNPPRVARQEFLDYRAYYGNDDIIGRLWIPNTTINYLVPSCPDNQFYLHHDIQGRRHTAGWVFLDYRADINGQDQNMVVFGHNMSRDIRLHSLRHFLDHDFFMSNRYIYFSTIYADYVFEVFSAYTAHISWPYIYTNYDHLEGGWGHYINEFARKSLFDAGIKVSENDRVLTLSTCVNTHMDYRIVLHARLVSETFPHLGSSTSPDTAQPTAATADDWIAYELANAYTFVESSLAEAYVWAASQIVEARAWAAAQVVENRIWAEAQVAKDRARAEAQPPYWRIWNAGRYENAEEWIAGRYQWKEEWIASRYEWKEEWIASRYEWKEEWIAGRYEWAEELLASRYEWVEEMRVLGMATFFKDIFAGVEDFGVTFGGCLSDWDNRGWANPGREVGNIYYHGQLVRALIDENFDDMRFMITSGRLMPDDVPSSINLYVLRGENGDITGIDVVEVYSN